jgi:hypothetical protein
MRIARGLLRFMIFCSLALVALEIWIAYKIREKESAHVD